MSLNSIISVILCTHNPRADYLNQVLESLTKQSLSPDLWEFILIDNASKEPLRLRKDLTIPKKAQLVEEKNVGHFYARKRGVQKSSGDLLIFVDDDTVLQSDYLEKALELYHEKPDVGVWSGNIEPVYEEPPKEHQKLFIPYLAIRSVIEEEWSSDHESKMLPCGAGMCVRREVALDYFDGKAKDYLREVLGRREQSLLAGDDTEIGLVACDKGIGCGLSPRLRVRHLIAKERLKPSYLRKLVEDVTFSHALLFYSRDLRKVSHKKLRQFNQILLQHIFRSNPNYVIYKCVLRGKRRALKTCLKKFKENRDKKKILMILHGDHGGAPRVLVDACAFLKQKGYQFEFIFLRKSLQEDSPVIDRCKKLGPVLSINWTLPRKPNTFLKIGRMIKRVFVYGWNCLRIYLRIKRYRPEVIYANTAITARAFKFLAVLNIPIVLHVHELKQFVENYCEEFIPQIKEVPKKYLAASEAVERYLNEELQVHKDKINLAYSAIDPSRLSGINTETNGRKGAFVIGGAGSIEARKGVDLWIEMAKFVCEKWDLATPIKFVWCGKPVPSIVPDAYFEQIKSKVEELGLSEKVEFQGFLENPYDTYRTFDVFTMTSREDPFPLVCLEAMYLEKPVVYFERSGGTLESVGQDAGVGILEYDPEAMADEVIKLLKAEDRRREMGEVGKAKVKERFLIENLAGDIDTCLASLLERESAASL